MNDFLTLLRTQFNNHVALKEKRPGIFQLLAPLFHEDGDMVDIFLEWTSEEQNTIRVCDYGLSIMRLSYTYEIDTQNKERIFHRILKDNRIKEDNGNLYIIAKPGNLYPAIMQLAHVISKVTNMSYFKREVIKSLFYEMLTEFINESLLKYNPTHRFFPIHQRDDLEVDYKFDVNSRPIYLFGVKDDAKARLTTISCLEFERAKIPFKSVVVHEDFNSLSKKDRSRITNTVDKQYTSLETFTESAIPYFARQN
ncbi:MAG: DUF1828 domain-containing protein [Candidatus Hatepunaea meridiana]|nr:DUF1828 domain-containing protein [Candidatus Hatepunaea meridiana]